MKALTVCVNYDDLLAITLPRNARHLTEIVVVTHPDDHRTQTVVATVPSARCHLTDAFYRCGARFNKGWSMEEGFDALGREGFIMIFDADTLLPDSVPLDNLDPETLYTAPRRILADPTRYRPDLDWKRLPLSNDRSFAGYLQIFHADATPIRDLPWYATEFAHAGGCDGYFESRWSPRKKVRLPFEVLHLGPRDSNWFGRASARADGLPVERAAENRAEMERYLAYKGWRGARTVTEFNERVDVPGHKPSGYNLRGKGE